jgi:hypothetical protein
VQLESKKESIGRMGGRRGRNNGHIVFSSVAVTTMSLKIQEAEETPSRTYRMKSTLRDISQVTENQREGEKSESSRGRGRMQLEHPLIQNAPKSETCVRM